MSLVALVVFALALLTLVVVGVNRARSARGGPVWLPRRAELPARLGPELSIATWNLGYAGLGFDSDFVADRGEMLRVPSRASAQRNLAGILEVLGGLDVDVLLLQEVAPAGPLNRHVELRGKVMELLTNRQIWFRASTATWGIPWPARLRVGELVASRVQAESAELVPLPEEPEPMAGLLNRRYGIQVMRLAGEDGVAWTVINLHLSAFDDGGSLRREQIVRVFEVAQAEHRQGRRVVAGGDWNMELTTVDFPHTTASADRFWLHDFPHELLPPGWQVAIDPSTPTVRTNHKPYVAGENFVTIIDGFIVSPDVEVVAVVGVDTGFGPSDHMPVTARFRAR